MVVLSLERANAMRWSIASMVQARAAGVNGAVAPCSSEHRITICGPRRIRLHLHY
jgi:hypothetical protein